jgi:uncharacterized membrane protein YeaQ/YmgE (transglycosylase-associated protein family)
MVISVAAWATLGVVTGLIAGTLLDRQGQGNLRAIALGIAGAVGGGLISYYFGAAPSIGLTVHSTVVAAVGSVVVLAGYYSVSSPDRTGQPPGSPR